MPKTESTEGVEPETGEVRGNEPFFQCLPALHERNFLFLFMFIGANWEPYRKSSEANMKKLLIICAALCVAATAADAQKRPRDTRECKEAIKAAGDAALRISKAEKTAIKAWQEQVISQHGERYMNFDNARIVNRECNPARVGGGMGPLSLKRCYITARPCTHIVR
jgi:hypothetical protein